MGAQAETRDRKTCSAPEIPTLTPAVNLRFNIEGLTKGHEVVGGLFVGEVEEKPNSPWMRPDVETIAGDNTARRHGS